MYYFWFAPTLTYQIAFPRSPRVRIWKVIGILMRLFFTMTLFIFLVAQVISPNQMNLVKELEKTDGVYTAGMLAHYGLKLSVANTYAWLLIFYMYFHLYLNLSAELLVSSRALQSIIISLMTKANARSALCRSCVL
jgi:diacylglycerol O-acyltransferase-1